MRPIFGKGQSEIVVFLLVFLIGVILFISASIWGRGIFEQNVDTEKVTGMENFMRSLDSKIQRIVKFGGDDSIGFGLDSVIELMNSQTIEIRSQVGAPLPHYWVNISVDTSVIREILDVNTLRVQLTYPQEAFLINLTTTGPKIAKPNLVKIRKGSVRTINGVTVIDVEVNFQ